jgi:hypothetical protein
MWNKRCSAKEEKKTGSLPRHLETARTETPKAAEAKPEVRGIGRRAGLPNLPIALALDRFIRIDQS